MTGGGITFFKIILAFFAFSLAFPAGVSGAASIKGLRHWSYGDYTRVVLDLTGELRYKEGRLSDPERLFIDVKGMLEKDLAEAKDVGDGRLRSIRSAQYDQDTVRIVLDLEGGCESRIFSLEDPPRLVIDLLGGTGKTSYPAPPEKASISKTVKKPEPVPTPDATRVIVLDAGHGGHDPGAIGKNGLREKDITLALALKLREILSKDPMNKIVLTRTKDAYLTLKERTDLASKNDADLFVSIHVNASSKRSARGVETYFLSWTDDEEVLKVASKENRISISELKKEARTELDLILDSLELQGKRDESVKLANFINTSIVSSLGVRYGDANDLGVKKGPFYVLYTKGIPSVLVEVSFISNPTEEKRLKSESHINLLAEAIAGGISTYIASMPPELRFARR